ncbi:MAG: DUF4276 family protein [Fimbriimonadaceae bacterium]|nr:DUF4276 family protein [Fimbriimonadaceae bacterium]
MIKLVILAEEESMRVFLLELLPKLNVNCPIQIVPHEGKSDLERSIPIKLKAWSEGDATEVRFIILRDNDGGDCRALKERLLAMCIPYHRRVKVRIVIQHLESWLLGDLDAIQAAYGTAISSRKAKFRNPDRLTNASQLLEQLIKDRVKVTRARKIGQLADPGRNESPSFQALVRGLQELSQP